jgi:hypothetical protein
MAAPLILLLASLAGILAALVLPDFSDLLLLAAPAALASLFLLLRARRAAPRTQARIVVDGSNVMHWNEGSAELAPLREVLDHLRARGFRPAVIFDANAGYKLAGRYLHDAALSRQLGLPEDQVLVVPKGTPADPWILTAARDMGARIVTNDRFRDWAETYPEVTQPGHLIRGGYTAGQLWLDQP